MPQRPENHFSPFAFRSRSALVGALALLLAGCSSNLDVKQPAPFAGDPPPTISANAPLFDPSTGVVPLPNLLVTGAVTGVDFNTTTPAAGHIAVNPGIPLTPDKALSYINHREVGATNAVSGITAPIYIRFGAKVQASTITPATVKVFQILTDSNGLTEIGPLGFLNLSSLFEVEMLGKDSAGNSAELQLNPRVALTPGSRYIYVVTDGVKDVATTLPITQSLVFGLLKYVKGSDVNPNATSANPGTNLADTSDLQNPSRLLGASAASLQGIYGNVLQSGAIVISGYGKAMDDLVANSAADISGKAASGAGPTGIGTASENFYQRRGHIKLIGRFITTAAGAIVPDPSTPSTSPYYRLPVEATLWAWANNAPTPPYTFGTAESRAWSNSISTFTPYPGTAAVNAFYTAAGISAVPHDKVGLVATGAYESGDLNMDPAIVAGLSGKPTSGDLTAGAPAGLYNPGNSTVPGTGVLQGARGTGGVLRGYYHVTRNVPFIFFAPTTPAPAGGYPLLVFQHGLGGKKEQAVAMANTACSVGYAVIAIDLPLHGDLGNGRPAAEWGSNFISLSSGLNGRTNPQQAGFNLWRLVRVTQQPAFAPGGLQNSLTGIGYPISPAGASRYVSISLGSIVGAYFLAGNSFQTGGGAGTFGTDIKAFFSVPGGRLAYTLRDSPTFAPTINAGLAAAGVPTGSPAYNQFFTLTQSIVDPSDPAYMTFPISSTAPSRLAYRVAVQEAIGDPVVPNNSNNYFVNSLAGRGILGSATLDTAPGFTQIRLATATSPTVPFLYGPTGLKPSVAPATAASAGPTEGIFQFGSPTTPATHGMLIDGSPTTPLAQRQMAIWLITGKIIDPADTGSGFPIVSFNEEASGAMQKLMPAVGPIYFPKAPGE